MILPNWVLSFPFGDDNVRREKESKTNIFVETNQFLKLNHTPRGILNLPTYVSKFTFFPGDEIFKSSHRYLFVLSQAFLHLYFSEVTRISDRLVPPGDQLCWDTETIAVEGK